MAVRAGRGLATRRAVCVVRLCGDAASGGHWEASVGGFVQCEVECVRVGEVEAVIWIADGV